MTHNDRIQRRREAAEFWDSHGIDEGVVADDVEERVQVRRPLSAMLTLRLDQSDLAKLKSIANAQGIGVTTMARKLLHERLQGASNQRARQTRRSEPVGGNIAETLEDAKASSEDTDLGFLVLSIDRLNQIDDIVSQHAFRLFVDGLKEQAVSITPSQVELFDKIKDLQPAD